MRDPDGWRAYVPMLVRSALVRFGPAGILDRADIEAIATCAVWRAWQSYEPGHGAVFSTWAMRWVRGDILHAYRDTSGVARWAWEAGERFEPFSLDALEDADKLAAMGTGANGILLRLTVEEGINRLMPSVRDVARLAILQGWAAAEIAEATGLPVRTVYAYLKRARQGLRAWLSG